MDILFGRQDSSLITEQMGLQPLEIGYQTCPPGHAFGPAIREGSLLHFIYDGVGVFRRNGQTTRLGRGEGFVIRSGDLIQYEADKEHPWVYGWILLSGAQMDAVLQSMGFHGGNDLFRFDPVRTDETVFSRCLLFKTWPEGRDLLILSAMLRLFAEIQAMKPFSEQQEGHPPADSSAETRIQRLCRFITVHHAQPLTLNQMAAEAGLNPHYLCAAFNAETGRTPHAYLTNISMTRACGLLLNHTLSIGDAARSVGYEDSLHFSRMFKRMFGMSPSVWRRLHQS